MTEGTAGVDHELEAALNRRVEGCQRLAGGADLGGDVQLALVVARLDLAAIVRGTLRVCASLPGDVARTWAGNFTKCLVLAGDPRKIASRFPLAHVDGDGAVAWVGPQDARKLEPLRRLLRPLRTLAPLALADVTVTTGAAPGRAVVTLATGGLRLEEYLVSLEHTLSEAHLLGHLDGVGTIALRHVDAFDVADSTAITSSRYTRVHKGRPGDPLLRLYSTVVLPLD